MKPRKIIIAGNWKMHLNSAEAVKLANDLNKNLENKSMPTVVICPPFTVLYWVANIIQDTPIKLGAQDMHWEEKGAYTGEISPTQIKDAGCEYVILGHSERRHIMGETNDMISRKLKAALVHNITPILCVGELLEERTQHFTKEVVERQFEKGVADIPPAYLAKIVIAYEPVWAIGTGKNATPAQAQEVHHFIRNLTARTAGDEIAGKVPILYGGSVKPDNISSLLACEDVDGALVGGASLDCASFAQIVSVATNV